MRGNTSASDPLRIVSVFVCVENFNRCPLAEAHAHRRSDPVDIRQQESSHCNSASQVCADDSRSRTESAQ